MTNGRFSSPVTIYPSLGRLRGVFFSLCCVSTVLFLVLEIVELVQLRHQCGVLGLRETTGLELLLHLSVCVSV